MSLKYEGLGLDEINMAGNMFFSFVIYMAYISIGMFLINLFPIATFDMGLIIASRSSDKFYFIISNDYFIKVFLILFMLFNIFSNISVLIINFFLVI